jgi:hypothetical protein
VKRNPQDQVVKKSPFGLLAKGFVSGEEIAKDKISSGGINFSAFKQADNYFAKQHFLPYNKQKARYMTQEEADEFNQQKDKNRQEWNDRMVAEHAAKVQSQQVAIEEDNMAEENVVELEIVKKKKKVKKENTPEPD